MTTAIFPNLHDTVWIENTHPNAELHRLGVRPTWESLNLAASSFRGAPVFSTFDVYGTKRTITDVLLSPGKPLAYMALHVIADNSGASSEAQCSGAAIGSADCDLWRTTLLQLVASLTLADHMGDAAGDVCIALRRVGLDLRWEDWGDLANQLGRLGITTLNGTEIGEPAEEDGRAA